MSDFKWDYIIAGGGISGTLCALKLISKKPDAKILMLEKDSRVGGRLRVSDHTQSHGFGLHGVHPNLKDLLFELMKDEKLCTMDRQPYESPSKIALLAANRITEIDEHPISKSGFRSVGGAAASKNWQEFETNVLNIEETDKPVSQLWKTSKKSAGVIVMQHLGRLMGIPDFLATAPQVIKDRLVSFETVKGDWDCLISDIVEALCKHEHFNLLTSAQIMTATFETEEEDHWKVVSRSGEFLTKNLIVAQPIWSAQKWLKKEYWNQNLLKALTKTTPSSLVTLTTQVVRKDKDFVFPFDTLMIPAESTQAIVESQHSVVFQVTIDYESSLQAPTVIKAVRQLKRAKKKFNLAMEESCELTGEYIALVPTAWAQPTLANQINFYQGEFELYSEKNKLFFVGDSYGESFHGDENCIHSFKQFSNSLNQAPL